MQKRKPNKTQIDALGRQLVRSSTLPSAEVDKIISDPELFDRVTKRIMQNAAQSSTSSSRWSMVHLRRYTAAVSTFAVLAMIVVGGMNLFDEKGKKYSAAKMSVPEVAVPDTVVRPDNPPVPAVGKLSSGRTTDFEQSDTEVYVDRAVYRATRNVEREAPARRASLPRAKAAQLEPEGEFYSIDGTGNIAEKAAGGKIIRVDLARSSLFALGVNVPLENESSVVKADLLVGSDGITRGIRVVE